MNGASSLYLVRRSYWLIGIRWIAAPAAALVTFVVYRFYEIPIATVPLYSIAGLLAVLNLLYFLHLRGAVRDPKVDVASSVNRAANAQISLDLLCLGGLIHFSGGVENPFLFYFVFHMIIASILLSRRAAFLQATFGVLVFSSVALFEYSGIIRHYCLTGFVPVSQHDNGVYVAGISFALISTLYSAVYMASSVAASLRERDASLQEMNKLLLEKDSIKSEYVYRVTHDIKGHLSAIRSCLDPVISGITGSLNPDQTDLVRRASRRTDTLLNFVRALLELTRMRLSRDMPVEDVSVAELIESAVSYVQARAAERSIELTSVAARSPGSIRGARVYLEETIANLVANAVKYSHDGGRVTITTEPGPDSVLIRISDSGIGIPETELPKVFDEFYRASNARRVERDGTGLGLSMARQVVERHGGEIRIKSEEGRGTTVSLLLPRTPAPIESEPPAH